jgi:hypothetical protein
VAFSGPAEVTTILEAVDRWVRVAATLPPGRRSAALFAADQLLANSGGPHWRKDQHPPIRQRLESDGATFEWLDLGGTYHYTYTWLKEALFLDPDGRAGELAFATLMEKGFETSGGCSNQHGEGFRAVIREGEAYLRRKPETALRADIHFLMAEAHADIVTLASGDSPSIQSDSARYGPEAAVAREKAIEHFRVAFEVAGNTSRAREAWPTAWRLVAGFAPTRTYFYCRND